MGRNGFLIFLLIITMASMTGCGSSGGNNGGNTSLATASWNCVDWNGVTDPLPTGWVEGNNGDVAVSMSSCCKVNNGVLDFDETGLTTGQHPYYYHEFTNVPTKVTFVCKVKAYSTADIAFDFSIRTNGCNEKLRIHPSNIELNRARLTDTSSNTKVLFDATSWHTYFISLTAYNGYAVTKVYVDGNTTPILIGTSYDPNPDTYNSLHIGDGSLIYTFKGSLDWYIYTTDDAFTPNSVKLPDGYTF